MTQNHIVRPTFLERITPCKGGDILANVLNPLLRSLVWARSE